VRMMEEHGDVVDNLHNRGEPGLGEVLVEQDARREIRRQGRNGAVSLYEVAYLVTGNALDVSGSDKCLTYKRGVHIELYRRLPPGDDVSLEVGGYFERKAIEPGIHAEAGVAWRGQDALIEIWRIQAVGNAHGERRVVLVHDRDRGVLQDFRLRMRRDIDAERERPGDQHQHRGVAIQLRNSLIPR